MNSRILTLKAKKLGIRIAGRRLKSGMSAERLCASTGLSLETLEGFELGETSPTLPELESIAFYLGTNTYDLVNNDPMGEVQSAFDLNSILELNNLRNRKIGIHLKKTRMEKNLTLDEIARRTRIALQTIEQYELGLLPIPYHVLESLCSALEISIQDFYSKTGPFSPKPSQPERIADQSTADPLPAEVMEFVGNSANRPYVELAKKLSEVNAQKLRAIAEALLEITY
jgi:transcriptional regulator with XRE-family HTH domain